ARSGRRHKRTSRTVESFLRRRPTPPPTTQHSGTQHSATPHPATPHPATPDLVARRRSRPQRRQKSLEVQSGHHGAGSADMCGEKAEMHAVPGAAKLQDGETTGARLDG